MGKEIEAKFINISKVVMVKKLEEIGATKVFDERLLTRCAYNLPIHDKDAWVRVRDEVDKVTMSYKKESSQSLDGVEEIEIVVDSFEKTRDFLKAVGLFEKAYQETKRMRYEIKDKGVVFDIDTWPGLEPWIEIEADNEEIVKEYALKLGFDWKDAMFGSAPLVYERIYNISSDFIKSKCPILSFDDLPFELSEQNKRK
jgi:adenylate cyclase class 2